MVRQVDTASSSVLEHQKSLPAGVPAPEQCQELTARIYAPDVKVRGLETPGDVRIVQHKSATDPAESSQSLWFKAHTNPSLGDSYVGFFLILKVYFWFFCFFWVLLFFFWVFEFY